MTWVVGDDQVSGLLDAPTAISAIELALSDLASGLLAAPPRSTIDLHRGTLVITAGSGPDLYGFRAYDTFGTSHDEQVTVLYRGDGSLELTVVGPEIGRRRTGAIGACAAKRITPDRELKVAVIGAGKQAFAQIWAISEVRKITEVAAFRRGHEALASFTSRVQNELSIPARACLSPAEACRGADLVILATNSQTPVVSLDMLQPECAVFSLGRKTAAASELDAGIMAAASEVVSDSVAQLFSDSEDCIADGFMVKELFELDPMQPAVGGVRVYLSTGLAGTELYVARALAARLPDSSPDVAR
jgi:ornithine cyclodeaminase